MDEETRNAVCLICKKQLSYMTGISNLRKHIQRVHPHITIDDDTIERNVSSFFINLKLIYVRYFVGMNVRKPFVTDD